MFDELFRSLCVSEIQVQGYLHACCNLLIQLGMCNGIILLRANNMLSGLQDFKNGFCSASVMVRRLLRLTETCRELHHLIFSETLGLLAEKVPYEAWTFELKKVGETNVVQVLTKVSRKPDACTAVEMKARHSASLPYFQHPVKHLPPLH